MASVDEYSEGEFFAIFSACATHKDHITLIM